MKKHLLLLVVVTTMPLSLFCYMTKKSAVHHQYVKPAIDNLHGALDLKPLTQDEKISVARYLMDYAQNPSARMPQLSDKAREVVKRIIASYTDIKEKNPHSARNYLKRASSEIMFYHLFSPKVHASRSTERKAMPHTDTKPKNSTRSTTGLAGQLPRKSTAAKTAKPAPTTRSVSKLQEKREERKAAKKARKAKEAAARRRKEMKERAEKKMALKSELWKLNI